MRSIAIMGFGVIGSGVYDVVTVNGDILKNQIGDDVQVKKILDLRDFPDHPAGALITHDIDEILDDPEISVIVETMGGVEPAFSFEMRALEKGKHVVTSNKELVEAKGAELFEAAKANKACFFFEASVGGGIPIIRAINKCLTADRIDEISGILNGTTNYILTSMSQSDVSYEEALKKAQELGYAEKDPTADVEGHDAGRKIAILASMVTGKSVKFSQLSCEGISKITSEDFKYAKILNMSIKLIASAYFEEDGVMALVAPRFVPHDNDLYAVDDVFNAVSVHGNFVDDVMFYGRGAGSHATASAVVADVIDALKHDNKTVYPGWSGETMKVKSPESAVGEIFVRIKGTPDYGLKVVNEFGGGRVISADISGEFGFITPAISEAEIAEKLQKINGVIKTIRIK